MAQLYPSSPLSSIALLSPVRASCPPKLGEVGAFLVQEEEGVSLVSQYLLDGPPDTAAFSARNSDLASAGAAGTAGAAPAP